MIQLNLKLAALCAFAALAGCEGANDADNIQAAAENHAEALEAEAQQLIEQADNAVGAAAETLENQAEALGERADNVIDVDIGDNEAEEAAEEGGNAQ